MISVMFNPWGSVALIVCALALIGVDIISVHRRQRRGEDGWTTTDKLGVASMILLVIVGAVRLI